MNNETKSLCDFQPPLTDIEISAMIDGDEDILTASNSERDFSSCSYCTANKVTSCLTRLTEIRQLEQRLKQTLFRFDCPDAKLIGGFVRSELNGHDLDRVQKHLEVCSLCQTEVAHLRRFYTPAKKKVEQQKAASRWLPLRSPLVWIANLIGAEDEAVVVRGENPRGDVQRRIVSEINDVTIFVEIEEVDDTYMIEGQVLSEAEEWGAALVELQSSNHAPRMAMIDDMSEFRFDNVAGDTVLVKITGQQGIAIMLPEIDLLEKESLS